MRWNVVVPIVASEAGTSPTKKHRSEKMFDGDYSVDHISRHPIRSTILLLAAIAAALATIALALVASGKPAVAQDTTLTSEASAPPAAAASPSASEDPASSLINGNFERGDLTGWTVDPTNGGDASAATSYAVVDPNWPGCEGYCGEPPTLNAGPHEGSYFAQLTPGEQSQDTTISQPFTASNGDRVSGWVFTGETLFQSWGYPTYSCDDHGQVVLTNGSGTTVATLFEDSGSSAADYGNSAWRYWEYSFTDVTGEGQFQIEAKQSSPGPLCTSYGIPSVLGLDDVKTSTVSVAPSPPKITSPQNNTYDSDGSFSVSGSAERGSTVELFEGTTSKGTTKADFSSGAWSIALSGVSDGPHTYSAKATNAAGTSNASSPVSITVDTVKPSAPTITSPPDNSYDTDGTITFDGYAEGGSTVKVYQDGATTATGSYATASTASAAWWYIYLTGVSEQSTAHTFDFTATDAAGNESAKNTVHVDVGKLEDVLLKDKTAPTVEDSELMPASGATNVPRDTPALANFFEAIDPKTVITTPKDPANPNVGTSTTFTLVKYGTTTRISASVWVHENNSNKTVSLYPSSNLAANTKYTVKIKGGTNGVKDLAGNQLGGGNQASGDYWWTFTTGSLPRK